MSKSSRAAVFAKGALQKRIVSRAQAEECLSLHRKARKRGKPVSIEDVFVRKGYMSRAEASSIAKRLKSKTSAAPTLALAPEDPECPSCGKDPGGGEDCFRCGALLATGLPGPRAIACGSCGNVVLKGTALCPVCARSVEAPRRLRSGGGRSGLKRVLDLTILVVTLVGMGYFIHQHAMTEPQAADTTDAAERPAAQHPALREARVALGHGDRAEATRILKEALAGAEEGQEQELRRALALVAPPELAARAAESGVEADAKDPVLRLRLAELALSAKKPQVALEHLSHVPEAGRDDRTWRLVAAARRASGKEWIEPMLKVESRSSGENRELALALVERGRGHSKNKRQPQALRDLRRARQVDADLAAAHVALGLTLLEAGELEEARVSLRKAIQLDSAPAAPWLALGLVMEGQGNAKAARANYEQFLRLARAEGGHEGRIAALEARLGALGPD